MREMYLDVRYIWSQYRCQYQAVYDLIEGTMLLYELIGIMQGRKGRERRLFNKEVIFVKLPGNRSKILSYVLLKCRKSADQILPSIFIGS